MSCEITSDATKIAACGLYCGAYLKGRCPGCAGNEKATWCKVRSCCGEKKIGSCAECVDFAEPRDCKKFHNPISRIIGFVLRSDRRACILRLREIGPKAYADEMTKEKRHAMKRK